MSQAKNIFQCSHCAKSNTNNDPWYKYLEDNSLRTSRTDSSDIDAAPILFDLDNDPNKLSNIASSQTAKVRELSAILDRETHGFTVGNQSYYR
jgi:hypothetical protein